MYIHTISPVSNIPRQSILTYFSKDELSSGTLVEVLYGKNKIFGIVIKSESLKNVKEFIRTQDFQLRKINRVIEVGKVHTTFMENIQSWSAHNFIPSGKIISDIFPKWFWGEEFILPLTDPLLPRRESKIQYIETPFSDRITEYKKEILNHDTVWICVPNVFALKKVYAIIKNDDTLGLYTKMLFHSGITEEKQMTQYKAIATHKKTIILSTPYYYGLFHDYGDATIFENTGDDGYMLGQKYTYNILAVDQIIESHPHTIVYGGDLLPLTITPTKTKRVTLQFTGYTKESTRFNELFVNEHIEKQFLQDTVDKKKILLLSQYKDNTIKIVCNDCKTIVTCPTCKLAFRTVTKNGMHYFHCNFCKKSYKSNVKCNTCQSWNLTALGINTKTIKEFVEKKYKQVPWNLLTISTITDSERFSPDDFNSVYVISLDGLMYNPHFNTEEKIVRTILKLQRLGTLFVQTSFAFPNTLSMIKNVSITEWKKKTLATRKEYTYPPFGTVYNITAVTVRDTKYLESIKHELHLHQFTYIDTLYRITIYIRKKDIHTLEAILHTYAETAILVRKEES